MTELCRNSLSDLLTYYNDMDDETAAATAAAAPPTLTNELGLIQDTPVPANHSRDEVPSIVDLDADVLPPSQGRVAGNGPVLPPPGTKVRKGMPDGVILQIAHQICSGMEYLLSMGIIHRDLKPENILLNDSHTHAVGQNHFELPGGRRSKNQHERYPFITKLCDFGLARYLPNARGGCDLSNLTMTATVGTPAFMAPEVVSQRAHAHYNSKSDVYSFGMLLWCMATGKIPYQDEGVMNVFALAIQVAEGLRPLIPETCQLKSLIEKCWANDPSDRPSFTEIQVELHLLAPLPTQEGLARQTDKNQTCMCTGTTDEVVQHNQTCGGTCRQERGRDVDNKVFSVINEDTSLRQTYRRRNEALCRSSGTNFTDSTCSQFDASDVSRKDVSLGKRKQASVLEKNLLATLGTTHAEDLRFGRHVVALPSGMHLYDWYSLHCCDFFFDVSVLANVLIPDTCCHESCFEMTAGPAFSWTVVLSVDLAYLSFHVDVDGL